MSTNTEAQDSERNLEILKWIVVSVLLTVTIVGNYLYSDILLPIRVIVAAILIITAGSIALLTTKGKAIIKFIYEARSEIHKVVWPTRQETLHITLIIATVTAVTSLVLWGLDSILVRLISFIISLRF